MAGADGGRPPRDAAEQRLFTRLRIISIAVVLVLIVLLVFVDAIGRLVIDKTFHIGDVIFASLVGALLTMLGLEGLARLPGK